MRHLLTWLQVHPAIGPAGRVQVGAAEAVDAENFDTGRRYEPDTDLDVAKVDAAMAATPPRSVAELLELVAGELSTEIGEHVAIQARRPDPEPEPAPVEEPAKP